MDAHENEPGPTRRILWNSQMNIRPTPLDTPESSPISEEQGIQRAAAAVQTMNPPRFLARISAPITRKTSSIITYVLIFNVVPDRESRTWLLLLVLPASWNHMDIEWD